MSRAINTITAATAADGATDLNIDSGTLFVNTTTNNVGIGTNSPTRKLTISASGGSFPSASNPCIRLDETSSGRFGVIEFDSSTNLNIWGSDVGSGSIRFLRGTGTGTESLRIDSSGRVGIGVTSPISSLHLKHATPTSKITLEDSSTNRVGQIAGGSDGDGGFLTFSVGNNGGTITERLRINGSGFMKASDDSSYVSSAGSFHELRNSTSNELLVGSNSNAVPYGVQLRFTVSPNNGTSTFLACLDGNGTVNRATIKSNGGLQNFQANDGNLSDERLKTDIQPSPSYLDKICSIPVVNFKYKDQTHDDYNLGVIAQQVESVCPEFVDADGVGETPEDGIPIKAIYQTDLQYALMKCIQELKTENDSLKSRIEALEAA